jgi:hypothetical protein
MKYLKFALTMAICVCFLISCENCSKQKERPRENQSNSVTSQFAPTPDATTIQPNASNTSKPETENIASEIPQYFPMDVGSTWTYRIDIGNTSPVYYQELDLYYKIGKNTGTSESIVRGKYAPGSRMELPQKRAYELKITIAAKATKQCDMEIPEGRKIKVIVDELGIYQDAENVYWTTSFPGTFHFMQITEMKMSGGFSTGANLKPYQICSSSLKGFGYPTGTSICRGGKMTDFITFQGIEIIPGTKVSGLHYIREVKGKESASISDTMNFTFTEDLYYLKGFGLAYLQQKVNGKIAMTWTLVNMTPAKDK